MKVHTFYIHTLKHRFIVQKRISPSPFFFWAIFMIATNLFAQQSDNLSLFFEHARQGVGKVPSQDMKFSIVHLNLLIEPNFEKETLSGQEQLTITPYNYHRIDSLQLNAKQMDIQSVRIAHQDSIKQFQALSYHNDSFFLNIKLDKTYSKGDTFFLLIDYVANPQRIKSVESKAITESKGLYFINADGKRSDLPTQIWTQGEPENNSVWFPIVEQHQQKFTQEISIIVPEKFQTVSNGLLVKTTSMPDHKRMDTWKLDLPNSPYLVFFAVGQWAVFADSFHQIPLNYYVNKEYKKSAKQIFQKTPKMMSTFEKVFQTPFAWPKYDQVVVNNFVSGAMENTTVVSHDENALQDEQDLADENIWENVIAHELSHHWFGDLVTCKDWKNLTLNESFANYSEYLWFEQEYGKFFADYYRHKDIQGYFTPSAFEKNLVRTDYQKPEDLFDEVTYNKGGAILHMLRTYLGDTIFFKSLQKYLTENKFKTAEVANLRMAFESVSGQGLDWFFDQWYFNHGNPFISIQKQNDAVNKQIQLVVKQNVQVGDNVYKIPITVKKYEGKEITTYPFWLGVNNSNVDTLVIPYQKFPELVSIDPEGNILMVKQETKSIQEYIYQLKKSLHYYEKFEALYNLYRLQHENEDALQALLEATSDTSSYVIRLQALERLDLQNSAIKIKARPYLIQDYKTEKNNLVIAKLIEMLSQYRLPDFYDKNKHLIESESAKITSATLQLLFNYDSLKNFNTIAKVLAKTTNKTIHKKAFQLFLAYKKEKKNININEHYKRIALNVKIELLNDYLNNVIEYTDASIIQEAVFTIKNLKSQLPPSYQYLSSYLLKELDDAMNKLKIKNKILYDAIQL